MTTTAQSLTIQERADRLKARYERAKATTRRNVRERVANGGTFTMDELLGAKRALDLRRIQWERMEAEAAKRLDPRSK